MLMNQGFKLLRGDVSGQFIQVKGDRAGKHSFAPLRNDSSLVRYAIATRALSVVKKFYRIAAGGAGISFWKRVNILDSPGIQI
jgi:hypothetical protein